MCALLWHLGGGGLTLLKLLEMHWSDVVGWIAVLVSVITLGLGVWSFIKVSMRLHEVQTYGRPSADHLGRRQRE